MTGIYIDGIDEALADIDDTISNIKDVSRAGLWDAGLQVINSAQKRLKPSVITGNLRASAYVRNSKTTSRPDQQHLDTQKSDPIPSDPITDIGVEMGLTALYALYVHENMNGRSPKFLENAIAENKDRIIKIISERAKDAAKPSA